MERIHTLRSIADETGSNKRTVQAWHAEAKEQHGEFGEVDEASRTRYFNEEEKGWILEHYDASKSAKRQSAPTHFEVESGNHQMILAEPVLPATYSLESLRTTEAIAFDDPLAVAAQFLQAADTITDAMKADIEARQRRLAQTKQAYKKIEAKSQEIKLEQRLYQIEARLVDTALNQETQALQDALKAIAPLATPDE